MSPPPPHPDDETPPPAAGWEVVEPARDPLLDDPLFAEIVEDKPLPDLKVEAPVAEPVDDLPLAEVAPARAAPVEQPRARFAAPTPPRPREEPTEAPKPQVLAACAVVGCFGLGFAGAMAFIGWALLTLLSGLPDERPSVSGAAPRPGPVGPTQMTEETRKIELPGRVHAVGRAAGGRYLLLHVQQTKEILVFDPNTGNLLGHRFECGPRGLFAGSASKLFIYNPDAKGEELQRWNLETGVREKAASRPANVLAPSALVAGAGVDGPVYFVLTPTNEAGSIQSVDGDTLAVQESIPVTGWRAATTTLVRASDDGLLWGVTTQNGATLVRLPPPPAKGAAMLALPRKGPLPPVLAMPSPDGKFAYSPVGVADPAFSPAKKLGNRTPYAFPTAHGSDLFLSVRDPVTSALTGPVRLHVAAEPDLSEEFPGVDVPRGLQGGDAGTLPPDQRIHVWPAAGIAAVIPAVGAPGQSELQSLDVSRVEPRKVLSEREGSFLVIASEPQLWAVRGKEWRYRPVVWTKVEPAPELTLIAGPPGMTVRNGEVLWKPEPTQSRADVTIQVAGGNRSAAQRFRLTVVDDPDDD